MHTCTNHHALIRSLIAEIRGLRAELEIEQEHNYRNRQAAAEARRAAREAESLCTEAASSAQYANWERDRLIRKLNDAISRDDPGTANRYLRDLRNL